MANGGSIKYSVGFNVDQSGLNKAKSALQELQRLSAGDLMKINNTSFDQAKKDLKELKANASVLEGALSKAFNANLGTVNVSKFNQELKKSNITLDQIYAGMSKAGYAGEAAFRKTATQVLTTNTQLKQSHKILDDIAKTMGNTIKWGIASSAMNIFTGSVQKAYGYVKHLDSSLNDIRIVTEKSAEQMDTFAVKANKAAKNLAASTTDYTEAALIYYQQGLADKEVQARAESTLKAANVTGQSGAEVSEQLTAVWNGYKVSAQETELYVDKLAAVAASTASDLEELSTGMSKVASAAAASGVDIDQLNGHLATVISVTRQAPESVGTAFKTIYARLGDLAVDGEDEFGTKLGEVSSKLKTMGIDILDSQGQMRDMGTVMEEVAEKWDGWTQAQRQAAAVAMAGKRQYNNLIALFDNWDMYTDAVNTSANAMGTLQNQQDIYMESTAAHLQKMQTSWEGVYDSVLDTDTINFWLDAFAGLGTGLEHLVDGLGGGNNALLLLGSTAMKVFDKQIANSLSITLNNFKRFKEQAENTKAIMETQTLFKGQKIPDEIFNGLVNMKQEVLSLGSIVSETEHQAANALIQATYEAKEQAAAWDDNLASLTAYANSLDGINFDSTIKNTSGKASWGDSTDIEALNNALTEQEARISKSQKALGNLSSSLDSMSKHLQNVGWDKEDDAIENYEKRLRVLRALMDNYRESLPESEQRALTRAIQDFDAAIDEEGRDLDLLKEKLIQAFDKQLKNDENNVRHFADVLEQEIKGASNTFGKEVDRMEQQWKEFQTALQQKSNIANVVNLIGTMGQLASAMQTIINLGSVWQNEDLSTGEKLLQTISSLGMTLPMLTMNLGQAKSGFLMLASSILGADNASIKAAVGAKGLSANFKSLGGVVGQLISKAFNPYVAIAAAVVAAGVGLYMMWTKDERAAKRAAEGARQAAEALEAVKTEQQAVADTLSAYEDAETAMSKLTKGTQEWRDALNETNNSVLTLLETFPELADTTKGYMENVNGQLVLTDEGKEYVQEQSSNKVAAAQSASYAASANALEAQNKSDVTDFARSVNYVDTTSGRASGVKTLDQATVNKAIEAINSTGTAFLSSTESIQETLGVSEEMAKALYDTDNRQELIELANTVSANTAAQELYYQQAIAGYLQDSETYQNATTEEQGVINQVAGAWLEKEADRLYESTYKQGSGMSDKDAQQAYAELIGAEDSKNKGGNKGEYLIDGEWKTVADEVARMALAMQEASGGVDAFAEDVLAAGDTISGLGLDDSTESAVLGFANGETADLTNLTATQLEEMSNALDGMSDEAIDQLADQLGYVSDGVKSAGDIFKEKVSQAAEDEVTRRAEDVAAKFAPGEDGFAKTSQDLHDSLNNMSIEDFRGEQRDALTAAGGTDALLASIDPEQIQRLVTEGVSLEDAFNEIDWSSMDSSKPTEWFKGAFEQAINDAKYSKENEGDVEGNFAAHAEEYDIDETVYRDLTERIQENAEASDDFADSLKTQEDAAQEVAKEILRYDKALESVQENGEEWLEVLENGAEQDLAENIGAISEAYENMLDLDPGALSDDFLENAENMKLMQQAAEGNTEAYEELQKRAGEDILAQVGIDTSQYAEDLAAIESMKVNAEGQGLADLEAGATLDNTAFLNSLSEMVTEAGMSAEEAQNYLASMGIDAEVTEDTTDATENNTVNSLMPSLSWENKSWNLPLVGDFTLPLPKLKFNPVPSPFSNKKQFKAHGLKVSNAKKSSGGAIKHKNSSHGGGSKRPSGGGGGGGGGSTPKRAVKTSEKKFDRYRKVNNELDKLTTKIDRLTEAQDKLFGSDLLNNLNKQLNIIKQQVTQTKKKLDIAKAEAKEMRTQRQANYKDENGYTVKNDLKDFGIKFNKNNEITNYKSKMQWYDNEIAKLEKRWNNMSAEEQEDNESLSNRIEALNNNRDTLEELVKDYDTLIYDTIPGLQDEITEFAYAQISIRFEAFHIEADLRLDLTEAYKDWADFQENLAEFEFPDDLAAATAPIVDSIDNLNNSRLGETLANNLDTYAKLWKAYDKGDFSDKRFLAKNPDGSLMKDAKGNVIFDEKAFKEASQEDMQAAMDYILEQEEKIRQTHENYIESIERVGEAYDEELEVLEYIGDQLEHNLNMIQLMKGETAYADMAEYYEDRKNNLAETLVKQEESIAYYKEQMEAATDEEAKETWRQLYVDALASYEETLEASAEVIQAQFENAVQMQLEEFDKSIGAVNEKGEQVGTRIIKTKWEIDTQNAEKYLDVVEKTYGLQTLTNKINKSINETDSISAKKKLNNLLNDELKKLREKDKLTQYDLDRANALYELELKKIALEEAQNNKAQMRLRRDASGNYSYQFVADQESIADAEQEVLDAQNNLYNLDKDEMQNRQSELWDTYQEYQDLMIEYSQLSATERAKYEDEYALKFANLQQKMIDLGAECSYIQTNLAESATMAMIEAYDLMGEEMNYTLGEIVPAWATGMDEMIDKINGPDDSFRTSMEDMFQSVTQASGVAAAEMETLGQASAQAMQEAEAAAEDWKTAAQKTTATEKQQAATLKTLNTQAQIYKQTWEIVKKRLKESLATMQNLLTTQLKLNAAQSASSKPTKFTTKPTATTTTTKPTTNPTSTETTNDNSGNESKNVGGTPPPKKDPPQDEPDKTPWWYKLVGKGHRNVDSFDTGGYTGDWHNDEGRLAVLHQKELVLNAKDTENILKAVQLVNNDVIWQTATRANETILKHAVEDQIQTQVGELKNLQVEKMVANLSKQLAQSINRLTLSLEPVSTNIKDLTGEKKSDIINIGINADFPNANSAKEIEQAFMQMANIATQRAYSNKR